MHARSLRAVTTALLILIPASALAAFPDVSASYAHRVAIDGLVNLGVVGGHPDGTFRPRDPVDRAAMLKMLYKARGLEPSPSAKKCFTDVVAGSWYESYVCDAVARGFVQGYADKTFKPARAVTRAEAIKLTVVVMALSVPSDSAQIELYADIGASDWFRPYVRTALARKVLPIAGQDGKNFSPHTLLERGEAAAYIWNALNTQDEEAAVSSTASSSPSVREQELQAQREQEEAMHEQALKNTYLMGIPFSEERAFTEKQIISYKFSLASAAVIDVTTTLLPNEKGGITCRLYRLREDGFSEEYYLGFIDGAKCLLRSSLAPGEYQLQLQPTSAGAKFSVSATKGTGDGNDGFREANLLEQGKLRTELLDSNDLEDWYTFKVYADAKSYDAGGRQMTVKTTGTASIGCLIYPLSDVDLFGFSVPDCNAPFLYPPGTYMVSIRHAKPYPTKQTYTVELK